MAVEVRQAGHDDDAVLATLRRAWAEERHGGPLEDADFDARFVAWSERERPKRASWLLLVDGRHVGMANVFVYERMPSPGRSIMRWGYVGQVFVLAEHRDAGLGTTLLDAVVDWARGEHLERLVLNPSQRSVAFYRRLGFTDNGLLTLDL